MGYLIRRLVERRLGLTSTRRDDGYSGSATLKRTADAAKEKAPRNQPRRLGYQPLADDQVCWIAESSQSLPRGRTKVQTSVASIGCSLPATRRLVPRSSVLSTSENRIATLA